MVHTLTIPLMALFSSFQTLSERLKINRFLFQLFLLHLQFHLSLTRHGQSLDVYFASTNFFHHATIIVENELIHLGD